MDTTHFRDLLTQEKTTLEAQLATVGRKNPSNPADWEAVPSETGQEADPNDRATVLDTYGENTAILTDLEIRLGEVNAALVRIEAGTYGVCPIGGEEIEIERLTADPAANTCKAHLV
ncbi:MAG: TraR/DksA family transcriptional regulator [Parcubacteria group bacterium]|nr:TraR/DksA family transcriptional regulator [Parcubacteria group bacterium]